MTESINAPSTESPPGETSAFSGASAERRISPTSAHVLGSNPDWAALIERSEL